MNKLTPNQLKLIHDVIHSPYKKGVRLAGCEFYVQHHNGLRFIKIGAPFENIEFWEQNPRKDSQYGRRAAAGAKITWGIRPAPLDWALIIDGYIRRR